MEQFTWSISLSSIVHNVHLLLKLIDTIWQYRKHLPKAIVRRIFPFIVRSLQYPSLHYTSIAIYL